MQRISICVLAIFVSASALAQVTKLADWANGPVRHLMTKEEMRKWKALRSDAEAQEFIDLFWAKRDPTPNTMRNEFREDFDVRVRFADDNFANARTRGAMSDPGRVFILLGPPYRVSGQAGKDAESMSVWGGAMQAPTDTRGEVLVGRPTRESNKQFWMYAHEKRPKFAGHKDFTIVFADEGQHDWKLAITERVNPEVMLQQAVTAAIVSPNLTKAPVYEASTRLRSTTFRNAELKTAYEQFRASNKDSIGTSNLTWGEFVTSEGEHFVSAQMYVPGGTDVTPGQKVTSFAVLENERGDIVDVKEEETTAMAAGTDAYVERSMHVEPGAYTTTFGLASGGRVLVASRTPMKIEGLDPKAAGVSPLILATSVSPLKTAWQPTDPFTFGGFKVVPKGDGVFAPAGDLWFFVELRNPGMTDSGVPNVRMQVDIAGKTSKGPVALQLPLKDAALVKLIGETARYGLGQSIPLDGFIPGEYTMKIHVVDVVLGKDYDLQKPFRIRG